MEITAIAAAKASLTEAATAQVAGCRSCCYSGENTGGQDPRAMARFRCGMRAVSWKAAMRTSVMLAIPAGILCSMLSPVGILGLVLMGLTGTWSVILYVRGQRPAWITIGAGARIGLVRACWALDRGSDFWTHALCHALLAP